MMAPCGNPMKACRFGVEPAGVRAHAVAAGLIAASSGSGKVAATPFNTERRETCFLDKYISSLRQRPIPESHHRGHRNHRESFIPVYSVYLVVIIPSARRGPPVAAPVASGTVRFERRLAPALKTCSRLRPHHAQSG